MTGVSELLKVPLANFGKDIVNCWIRTVQQKDCKLYPHGKFHIGTHVKPPGDAEENRPANSV